MWTLLGHSYVSCLSSEEKICLTNWPKNMVKPKFYWDEKLRSNKCQYHQNHTQWMSEILS